LATIGKNIVAANMGLHSQFARGNVRALWRYTAIAGDFVDQFFVWSGQTSGATAELGVYTFVGGVPVDRVGAVISITIPSVIWAWYSSAIVNIPLTAGVEYIVALRSTGSLRAVWDSFGGSSSRHPFTVMPLLWAQDRLEGEEYSHYANVSNTVPSGPTIIYPCRAQLIT
jgi:hypothetical protein